ncbi:hypothetical protein HMPREF9062_1264 [Actinomyces sp. oral taxon 448 str. F0400]|jgi:hypothetical protein|nr:hypothetical protein HMPREF9062_1264 [Actinomyces sp. oral taxon 448 str. F0400]
MSARIDVVLNTFDAPDALDALSTHRAPAAARVGPSDRSA